ncbi:MAG: hypothetical protein A3F80_03430 [Candidatus Melainabacteria bacterium RIFCSPLOWO2_12_FULL_35_11]|nr:MAG: hypothetical protein A3F80_03430 [Candidatus Melainabacteria bacterium RIFCSPLOWO2_12_FULL_35_11]
MKKNIVILMFTFVLASLPALANEEIIKSFTTEDKLPQQNSYIKLNVREYRKILREKKKKGGKGNLGTDAIVCPKCPLCTDSAPSTNQCLEPTSLRDLVASRYTFNISIIQGLTDTFQVSIFNLNPSTGIFNYTATNLRTGISQSTSVGLLDYDAVHFTLGTINIPDSFGNALIHALDCTGFLNSDRTLSGVCSTIGQETVGPNLIQVAQPFNAVPN